MHSRVKVLAMCHSTFALSIHITPVISFLKLTTKTITMKTLKFTFKKMMMVVFCIAALGYHANATVFTAVLSGNFNAATTWGGSIPSSILTTDVIIIPSGVTVTLNVSASFSASSSLTVNGALNSGSYATALHMTSGSFSGSGTVNVDSLELGLMSGYAYTGNLVAQHLTSIGANISSASNIMVHNTLRLTSGTMNFTSGSLTLGAGAVVEMAGGAVASSGSGTLHLDSMYHVIYMASSATTATELSGSGLRNITISSSGAVTLSSNLSMNGTLYLNSGTLMLNGHSLTFGTSSNLGASGGGTLSGNTSSDITIMTSGSLSGSLNFASGGNTLRNLSVHMGGSSATAMLGSSLNLTGNLNLQNGKLKLGANNLNISSGGSLSGGSSGSYVIADGTGMLVMHLAAGNTDSFKVGTTTTYAPIAISANSSSATGDVSVNVMGDVYSSGTTGSSLAATRALVKNTWYVSSSATSGISYDMTAMWDASMEVNGYNRTSTYLSHYTGGAWDVQSTSGASASGSMYMITRTGITSLSPFMVADNTTFGTTSAGVALEQGVRTEVNLYPNPTHGILYLGTPFPVERVRIHNMTGLLVFDKPVTDNRIAVDNLPEGMYIMHITGSNFTTDKTFIKK